MSLGGSLLLATALVAQSTPALIAPIEVSYLGAFRLADPTGSTYSTWEYSNAPVAYYPDGDATGPADGFPGSLFLAGHVYESRVAELEIPAPVRSKTPSDLPIARILQPMVDVTAGMYKSGFIMGMTYVPGQQRIYFTHGQDYSDSDCSLPGSPPGLGSFRPALSSSQSQGLWYLSNGASTLHPFTSLRDIMEVPQVFADAKLAGRGLATGRHRGWCPEGTNLYASAPWSVGPPVAGASIPSSTLMQFGNFTQRDRWSKEHSSANAYQGAAWLTAGTKSAVIITGIIDYDPARSYYGYDNWKTPDQCDPDPAANGCTGQRGWRAADPRPAILFYNPDDLAAVAAGTKQAWDVHWYAKLDIEPYMLRDYPATFLTTGATAEDILTTFDRTRGLLYVTESFADGLKPVVHVFKVAGGPTPTGLLPPSNLRVVK